MLKPTTIQNHKIKKMCPRCPMCQREVFQTEPPVNMLAIVAAIMLAVAIVWAHLPAGEAKIPTTTASNY